VYCLASCERKRLVSGQKFLRGEPQLRPRRLRQSKTVLIATFTVLFLAEADLVLQQERTQIFASNAQKTGSALMDFAQTRAQLLQRKDNESFAQFEQRISTVNADTQSLYSKLYSLEVVRLRDGFASRGLRTPELDEFYQRPGSTVAIREIGRALLDMGAELRSEYFSTVIKGWWRRAHPALASPSKS
jgi:hypothetical protein